MEGNTNHHHNDERRVSVIYEDADILVIDKPSGLVVHGDGRTEETSVASWVLEKYPELREVGEPWVDQKGKKIFRPGIVHRLDRDTSGVMVLAKTQDTFEFLKGQFRERNVKKTYRAWVYGAMKEREGEIHRPIGKSKIDFRKWSAQPGSRGTQRDAFTAWEVLHEREENGEKYSLLELTPTTGRTHQLRVHLKAIHHPIVCDTLYAPKQKCALGFTRLALHAHTISVPFLNGKSMTFEAPLPDYFRIM
jgi:23S rRNA pseudouridine1911/1915/1917 synthase